MGLLKKLRRHAAVARGDFGMLFKDVKIPPLPAAVNRLIAEINRSEPDIDRLVQLISSDPEITAKVIKTVNSSLYSPRAPQHTLFFRVVAFFSRLQLWYLIRKIDNPHVLLVLEAILFNRIIGGLPYPLWRADPKVARNFGAMAGIPDSETTFWRQLAAKTLQRRGS